MKLKYILPSVFILVCLLTLFCFLSNTCTLLTADQKGYRAFYRQQFTEAAQSFSNPMWKGTALYRNGSYKEAAGVFGGYDNADAAYNHGNCLVMLGKYDDAIQRYQRALQLRPTWTAAQINLKIAQNRAAKLKKEGGKMTDGQLEADAYDFTNNKETANTEEENSGETVNEAELQAMWLHNVQTKPADFLRAKFAYQVAMKEMAPGQQDRQQETSLPPASPPSSPPTSLQQESQTP